MKKIGEGAISKAYLVDDNKTLLVGKLKESYEKYLKLADSMAIVDGKIKSVKIPENFVVYPPNEKYPLGSATFDYVSGVQYGEVKKNCTDKEKIAIGKKLAEFIAEISAIKHIGDKQGELARSLKSVSKSRIMLDSYLDAKSKRDFDEFVSAYNSFLESQNFCWTHGDLHGENLILNDKNELTGVIDFGNKGFYVSEIEYAWMLYEEPLIYESMIKHSNKKINHRDVALVHLAKEIRYFKTSENWDKNRKDEQAKKILRLLNEFSTDKKRFCLRPENLNLSRDKSF